MPLALLRWVIRKYGYVWRVLVLKALKFYFGGASKIPKSLTDYLVPDWTRDVVIRIGLIGNFSKSFGALDTELFQLIASVMQQRLHSEHHALLAERIIYAKNPVLAFLRYLITHDQLTPVMRQRLYVNFHIVKCQIKTAASRG